MQKSNFRQFAMIPIICTFLLVAEGSTLTQEQFKQKLNDEVSVPFTSSISSYSSILQHLSDQLSNYNADKNEALPPVIPPALTNSVNGFVSHLQTASSNANSLTKATSQAVAENTNEVSNKEDQIKVNEKDIQQTEAKVQGEQVAVNNAKAALNTAQQNLNTFQYDLHKAEERYEDAKSNCLGLKRRKRGIFDDIGKVIGGVAKIPEKVVRETYKGVCQVSNVLTDEIDRAKDKLRDAESQVNQASGQLNQKQTELTATEKQLEALQKTHSGLVGQKSQFQDQLTSLKKSLDELAAIDEKMKRTVVFLDGIKSGGSAAKFAVDLGYLLDPANLVQPLQEVGNALKTLTGKNDSLYLPSLSSEQIQSLLNKMNAIKDKMPSLSILQ